MDAQVVVDVLETTHQHEVTVRHGGAEENGLVDEVAARGRFLAHAHGLDDARDHGDRGGVALDHHVQQRSAQRREGERLLGTHVAREEGVVVLGVVGGEIGRLHTSVLCLHHADLVLPLIQHVVELRRDVAEATWR